jgi:hypothetical protein
MNKRIFHLLLFLLACLLSCASTSQKITEITPIIDIASAKLIAIKHLQTLANANDFLPESTTVTEFADDIGNWSVFIKRSNWEMIKPSNYLIFVNKISGKPTFIPLK